MCKKNFKKRENEILENTNSLSDVEVCFLNVMCGNSEITSEQRDEFVMFTKMLCGILIAITFLCFMAMK